MMVDVSSLLPHLIVHQLLTDYEAHVLISQFTTQSYKAQQLLLYLNHRGNNGFLKLLCSLNKEKTHLEHSHLAAKLQKAMKLEGFDVELHCPVCKTRQPTAKPENVFKKLYYQAKHNLGLEKLQLVKLLIFGPPGAGKSSLLKVLLGGDPDAIRNSTGVCNKKLVQYTIAVAMSGHVSTSVWAKLGFEDEIRRLKEKIDLKLADRNATPESVSHNTNLKSTNLKIEDAYFFDQRIQLDDFQISVFNQVVQQTSALIACYDSGGQPEFFDVMPALTTAPTGYVMVFDMSKDILSKNVEFYKNGKKLSTDNAAHYTNAELMKTVLANIQSSAISIADKNSATRVSKVGHLLVVGTHLDKCGDSKKEQDDRVLQLEQMMEDDILRVPMDSTLCIVERQQKSTSLIHPISNTVKNGRDDVAQEIRTAIENMSDNENTSEDIPISWLLFQLEIRHSEKYYISHQRCLEIAEDCYIKKEHVDEILKYFHELGILLHYSHISALQHVVFCDPQWLFDKLTKLIELKYDPPREIKQKLFKGIFDKNFLSKMYQTDFVTGDILNYEHLLHLFVSLNIMAVLPGETDQYFMPALLNPAPADVSKSMARCYGNKIYDTLIVKFSNRYVPRGVFCCLVAECMKNDATGWSVQYNKAIYKDLIIFQISNDQFIFLKDRIDSIAVEMYHHSDTAPMTNANIVCETLYITLEAVCKKLQIKDDFTIGFACRCKLVDGTMCDGFAGCKNRLPFHAGLLCEKCNRKQTMEKEQVFWLISIDFLKEMEVSLPRQHQKQHEQSSCLSPLKLQSSAGQVITDVDDDDDGCNILSHEPEMADIQRIVIPRITAYWEDVAYALRYKIVTVNFIREKHNGDPKACSRTLFVDWLSTNHGAKPKQWRVLLEKLREVEELSRAVDEIEKKLSNL